MEFDKRLKPTVLPLVCTIISAFAAYTVTEYWQNFVTASVLIVVWLIPVMYLAVTVLGFCGLLDVGISCIVCIVAIPLIALVLYLLVGMFVFSGISGVDPEVTL